MKPITPRKNIIFSKIIEIFLKSSHDYKVMGQVLKQDNIISEDQLQSALNLQTEKLMKLGRTIPLGKIIVDLGYASEAALIKAVNNHYGLSVTSLSDNIKQLVKEKRGAFIEQLPTPSIPIWLQLSTAATLIIVITIFVLSFVILNRQEEQLYQQTVKSGMISLTYFSNNARIPLLEDNILSLNTLIKNAIDVEGVLYAVIVDQAQVIKAHTDHHKIGMNLENINNAVNRKITQKGDVAYFNYTTTKGQQVLNLSRPITFKDKVLGEVHVGISIDFIKLLIYKERLSIIVLTLCILLLGIAVAILLGFRFSVPISKLVLATQEISRGNYNYRVKLNRNDELGNFAAAFNQMSEELLKNSLMQKSFGKYVGSEVLEMIMSRPESPWLKGHKNDATILFADMRGFTSYSEMKEPEEVVKELNEYFGIATHAILNYGGYVDKFMGDAILGVFGIPIYHENHTERAVRAAVAIQKELKDAGKKHLASIGVGIDSGVVVAGNIGSQAKMEYTVIGDCVNIASRLETLAGPGEIIISKNVYDDLEEIIVAETLPPQKIKGKSEPVKIFKVQGFSKGLGKFTSL